MGGGRRLTRFEAMLDLMRLAVTSDTYDVSVKDTKVRLHRGQFVVSVRDCMRRWGWGSRRMTGEYLAQLTAEGIISQVERLGNIGTVYFWEGAQEGTLEGTLKGTLNQLTANGKPQTEGTLKGTPKGTPHLLYIRYNKYKEKTRARGESETSPAPAEKEPPRPVTDSEWDRFRKWAFLNIPGLLKEMTRDDLMLMRAETPDANQLADDLIAMQLDKTWRDERS